MIGRGGFGTVYRADLLGEGAFVRPVALKVLNPSMERVATVAARLRDEARLLGRVRHRAIVQVDGLVKLEDRWTVVMEYVEGIDLARLDDPVPARPALEIVGEVASALAVAHQWPGEDGKPLQLLHRDLKPGNVLLTAAGEVKVVDFGVARGVWATREARTHGMRFGSPGYVAPERLEGEERAEGDVYSLGVVLYELLAGRNLDRSSVRRDRAEAQVKAAVGALPSPAAVIALVGEMLAWNPADRPATREVERRCRLIAAEVGGPYLRDWAEEVVPALSAGRKLGAASDFVSPVVVEGSGTASGSAPAVAITTTGDVSAVAFAEDLGLLGAVVTLSFVLVATASCGGMLLGTWFTP